MSIDERFEFRLPKIDKVKTAGAATDLAINWQHWQSDLPYPHSLSYGEVVYYQNYFEQLADKFNLTEEFRENAII